MAIDAVITWVDGDDPRHAAKRARYGAEVAHPGAAAATRFASRGELGYCVRSILLFCPFVRRIFIVTDDQYPDVLDGLFTDRPDWRNRVEVVDHQIIYRGHEDLLPVFSSRSIETMMHRLPSLSERFLYLNDDTFIARPLEETHFFLDGMPVLRGNFVRLPNPLLIRLKRLLRPGPARAGFKEAQMQAARLAGSGGSYLLAGHHPHAMRGSTLARFFEGRDELLREQARHRFRSAGQVSPIGLANHLELAGNAPVEPPVDAGFIKPPKSSGQRASLIRALAALERGGFATLCVQSLDMMSAGDRELVLAALDRRYSVHQAAPGIQRPAIT